MKLDMKAERLRLHEQCTENDDDESWSNCCLWYEDEYGKRTMDQDRRNWCDVCLASDIAHEWYLIASRMAAGSLRRLERAVKAKG